MRYFDAHAHLQLPEYDHDREQVLRRMQEGETGAIIVGVDIVTSRGAIELAQKHAFLYAAVGLHPNDNPEEEFDPVTFAGLAAESKVVAIGECGLDYYRREPTPEEKARQAERFMRQLELAEVTHKPLIVHCRPTKGTQNAHEDMLGILSSHPGVPAVIHFFTSTAEIARKYTELGCFLSFPGPITYTDMYDAPIEAAPLNRLLTETDSPFAAPVPYRGKRNEPSYVAEVIKKIAVVKDLPVEEVQDQVVRNAQEIFGLS